MLTNGGQTTIASMLLALSGAVFLLYLLSIFALILWHKLRDR